MKVKVEIDCTPEEARRFLGLPDVTRANEMYVDAIASAMQGGNLEQLQAYVKQLSPVGELGMQFFRQFMEGGMGAGSKGGK
jgi:hypothetical protein